MPRRTRFERGNRHQGLRIEVVESVSLGTGVVKERGDHRIEYGPRYEFEIWKTTLTFYEWRAQVRHECVGGIVAEELLRKRLASHTRKHKKNWNKKFLHGNVEHQKVQERISLNPQKVIIPSTRDPTDHRKGVVKLEKRTDNKGKCNKREQTKRKIGLRQTSVGGVDRGFGGQCGMVLETQTPKRIHAMIIKNS